MFKYDSVLEQFMEDNDSEQQDYEFNSRGNSKRKQSTKLLNRLAHVVKPLLPGKQSNQPQDIKQSLMAKYSAEAKNNYRHSITSTKSLIREHREME